MTTTLSPDFLKAVCLITGFKGSMMQGAQAALLLLALEADTINATMLPGEITQGSRHLAGAAVGSLVAMELLECCGRIKSPLSSAKGRKLDVLRIPEGRRATVQAWLRGHGYHLAPEAQLSLAIA